MTAAGGGHRSLADDDLIFTSASFSADGKWIASSGIDGGMAVWDADTYDRVVSLRGHEGFVSRICFSPDSTWIASTGDDSRVRVWDWAKGKEIHVITSHSRPTWDIVFLPNGRRIVSSDGNGWIKLFDALEGREIMSWQDGAAWIAGLSVSPDGSTIASAPLEGSVHLWETHAPIAAPEWPRHVVEPVSRRVDERFERLVFASDVVASFESDEEMEPPEADLAVQLARVRGDDPYRLNRDCWNVVWRDDCDDSEYRQALPRAEVACRIVNDCSEYQCTRALALYRVGQYREALEAFQLAYELRRALGLAIMQTWQREWR